MNIDQSNASKAAMAAQEKQRAECVAAWQVEEQRQREQACKIVNHHFRHPDIAYSFRPLSYWEIPGSPLELVLRNVKGTKRREMIRDFTNRGDSTSWCRSWQLMNSAMKIGRGWARSTHHLWAANTFLAIVAMRSRLCELNSIRPPQMSSVYGLARSAVSDRG